MLGKSITVGGLNILQHIGHAHNLEAKWAMLSLAMRSRYMLLTRRQACHANRLNIGMTVEKQAQA